MLKAMSEDQESQSDEILALQSIYNKEELYVDKGDTYAGHFYAFVSLPEKILLVYKNLMNDKDELESITVEHLPPICLYFDLPHNYPSAAPPTFKISCPWLSIKLLVYLSMKLDELWLENTGTPILYTWIDFLKNETFAYLEITNVIDIRGIFTQDLRLRTRKSCKPFLNKRFPRPAKRTNNNRNPGNPTYFTPIDVLDNAQDCEHSSSNNINLNEGEIPERLVNLKADSPIESSSPRRLFPTSEDKNSYEKCVKDKFGIDVVKPKYINNITFNVVSKFKDRVERKKTSNNIIALLLSFNEDQLLCEFKKKFYNCDICFQSQVGAKCTQFKPCDHVYCVECIHSYFAVRVSENTVQSMPCPHDKCTAEASQNQIKEVLGDELYLRYDRLLLNATLDMMSDVVYCPRKGCQLPVLIESDWMAYCHSCAFAFCALCLRTYHGVQPCAMKSEEKRKLAMKYNEATGAERALMEARYGKQQLVTLLQNVLSTDWITEHSKGCPSCKTSIEKSDGCNKMVCTKCNTIFCWLCHTVLERDSPYKHFYDLKSKCYNQLFFGLTWSDDEEDVDDDDEGFDFLIDENLLEFYGIYLPRDIEGF